jgi:hypothetical protein
MYGLSEEKHITSSDQGTSSNVVDISSYRRVKRIKRIVTAMSGWPVSVQVAWDLAH